VSGEILGPFSYYGGYASYSCTSPAAANFEFGGNPFTIGWWEARIDTSTTARASVARDGTTAYVPWCFNYYNSTTKRLLVYMSSNGSSWDIANGVDIGSIQTSRWTHYEFSRDSDKWFYAFVNGKLMARWYSALSFPANTNAISIGRALNAYTYTAVDEFYIYNRCLHTQDFDTPKAEISIYRDEDYWGNTIQTRTGTNITADVTVTPAYGTESVQLTLANANASDGYIYAQVRGLGVYFDGTETAVSKDDTGIAGDNYIEASINQKYQHSAAPGKLKADAIINNRKTSRTDLLSISFDANRSSLKMRMALQLDVGDLVEIANARTGIDGSYFIQSRSLSYGAGGIIRCSWRLCEYFGA
jgi:hypothetical protein